MRNMIRHGSQEGMALVLTLAVLVLVTAMVVEFAHGVFVNTGFTHNWMASKRLSLLAESGVNIASKILSDNLRGATYTYPGVIDVPPTDPFGKEGDGDIVTIRIEDENAKFNVNSLLYSNGTINEEAYEAFRRLLMRLGLEEAIAPRVADWLDKDEISRLEGSDRGLKNARLESVDEIMQVPGINNTSSYKLVPYVTVHGSGLVNVNGADVPVLMALDSAISEELANRIISYRLTSPLKDVGQITSVAGFETLGISLAGRITVKGEIFTIRSVASSVDGIKRAVTCMVDSKGNVKYWKER